MSEDRKDLKRTIIKEDKDTALRASEETRIYIASETDEELSRRHTWIGEGDEPGFTRIVNRNAATGADTWPEPGTTRVVKRAGQPGADTGATRVVGRQAAAGADSGDTRVVGMPAETKVMRRRSSTDGRKGTASGADGEGSSQKGGGSGSGMTGIKDSLGRPVAAVRRGVRDLRKVKVADKKKFARFLTVVGVLFIILVLEIGYFVFASHVKGMPAEIKETQKELELTRKENELLKGEIEALGDYDGVEELRASWERLKDKLEKATEETSS